MKRNIHIIVYGILILSLIVYNFFFQVEDAKTNTAINIVLSSILFGYIAFMGILALKRLKK